MLGGLIAVRRLRWRWRWHTVRAASKKDAIGFGSPKQC
jgi:hypothetical protein